MRTFPDEKSKLSIRFTKDDETKQQLQQFLREQAENGNEMQTYRDILRFLLDFYYDSEKPNGSVDIEALEQENEELRNDSERKDSEIATLKNTIEQYEVEASNVPEPQNLVRVKLSPRELHLLDYFFVNRNIKKYDRLYQESYAFFERVRGANEEQIAIMLKNLLKSHLVRIYPKYPLSKKRALEAYDENTGEEPQKEVKIHLSNAEYDLFMRSFTSRVVNDFARNADDDFLESFDGSNKEKLAQLLRNSFKLHILRMSLRYPHLPNGVIEIFRYNQIN